MSFLVSNSEDLLSLGKEARALFANNFSKYVPSGKFISELPLSLKSQRIKPISNRNEMLKVVEATVNCTVLDDDIFVCSLPKSGSSWMTTIVWLLTNNLNYEAIEKAKRDQLVGDFDEILVVKAAQEKAQELLEADKSKSLSESAAFQLAWNEHFLGLKSPRVIKTHAQPYCLPKDIWSKGAKVIYVVRNLKDTIVSFYYFTRNFFQFNSSMDDTIDSITNDISFPSPYLEHIQNFWTIRKLPNVFFIAYEDLVNDSFASLKKMCEFLQCNYSDEQLNGLTEYISFKNMKNVKSINREEDVARMETINGKKRLDADFTFMRKGKPGGYRDDLNEEQIKKIDDWMKSKMAEGFDFNFNIYCE